MNARLGWVVVAVAAVGMGSLQALAQGPAGRPAPKPAIATVGERRITREDWERRSAAALAELARRNGGVELPVEMRDLVRRQVLEGQIRMELLALEARRTGLTVSPLEAEEVLKQDPFFNPGGRFDESRFIGVKTTQPAQFQAAIAGLRDQLAGRALNQQLEARYAPSEATLRRDALLALSRATLEHLSLRRSDFSGEYPEPRESDVLAAYRARQADYQRPARATLTIAFVNSPGLSDSVRALPGGADAWTNRMKGVADSLLREIARGASLEAVAGYLGPRSNTVVTSDNFPGYWRGTSEQNARLFEPGSVGKVVPFAFPAVEGWLVVRVDELTPAHVAPLREVAREIRGVLRKDRRVHHEEYAQRAYYERTRESLAAPGWRIRWAVADAAGVRVSAPTDAGLEQFYREHLADYSAFDTREGVIRSKPFAEVKDEVRTRWQSDRQRSESRLQADALFKAWSAGKDGPVAGNSLTPRETPALVHGAVVDSGEAARVLSDTLWTAEEPRATGMVPWARGWVVWKVVGREARVVPTFEQAREIVAARWADARNDDEEQGGYKLWQADPLKFGGGSVIHLSRFRVPVVPPLDVKLTRADVERYHRDNLGRYSAPELVTAKHILISPANATPEADRAALRRAEEVLQRARAGEDFAKLAKDYSEDEATKDKGGELGTFGRGTMTDAFERAVFALQSATFAPAPVRTPLGYHVVYCIEHVPAVVHPLDWVYTIVGTEAAQAKAIREAKARADSILRVAATPAAAMAIGRRMGLEIEHYPIKPGDLSGYETMKEYSDQIVSTKPGHLLPTAQPVRQQGFWVSWVDSITPGLKPTWEEARAAAAKAYRAGGGQRALDAKRAELDTLFAAGWSLDSVAALWGGLERASELTAGRGLTGMGGAERLDSLVFGGPRAPALEVGKESGWVEFPNGVSRLRLLSRTDPTADQVAVKIENDRAATVERSLIDYFAGLRKRYPVSILDPKMREMNLATPAPPTAPGTRGRR